mgnify:CR=1 FL=1
MKNQIDLKPLFITKFQEIEGKAFIESKENNIKLNTILNYFSKDPEFYNSPILNKTLSEPSFDKGLLIIGSFGTGKTAIMMTFSEIFKDLKGLTGHNYIFKNVFDIVMDYECLSTSHEKRVFYDKISKGKWLFDDILTEEGANNYGKINLFKRLLEIRYSDKKITYCTCNYNPSHPEGLEESLLQFHHRYDGRVYDRLFEMFNIIEFKGKSLRK